MPSASVAPRRRFLRLAGACLSAVGAFASGCASLLPSRDGSRAPFAAQCAAGARGEAFDYVVVGSGAGGGPLAANLARAGFRVLLLEAGNEEPSLEYEVPAFHARASEDARMCWNFFVRHYPDDERQRRDPKFCAERGGVLYPRCATLGGCTAHNAMILVYPHDSDWDRIAELTADTSWSSANMRRYFERLERCEYRVAEAAGGHGFRGWLATSLADPLLLARDALVQKLLFETVTQALGALQSGIDRLWGRLRQGVDPNDARFAGERADGLCMMPLTTHAGVRVGARDYVRAVRAACPDRLVVRTHALATRVLLDANRRATGVEYLVGEHLYRADPLFEPHPATQPLTVDATREVIVCAGAFNTPQLLKLSGIGPREELERLGIPVRLDRPGVGENLQDRYEISVVSRAKREFALMQGMTLRPPLPGEADDAPLREWRRGKGPYTTNGALMSLIQRSAPDVADPDLFAFALLGSFAGYFPGYSQQIANRRDLFTWAILKAHTHNCAGRVRLRSRDPCDTPDIDFHYFEGSGADEDLAAVVAGVQAVRAINGRCDDIIAEELLPGPAVRTPEELRQYIRDNAWGHHACGTCRIGPAGDPMAVVDGAFRVHGTQGLRVVDASVFPTIPGFFIACSVYMISEKASEVIVGDASAV